MSKGDGDYPDFDLLPAEKLNLDYIRSCMFFVVECAEIEEHIESWRLLDDGLQRIDFTDGVLESYPSPVVEFTLKSDEIKPEELLSDSWGSAYKLEIPECNAGSPFHFEDHNGYSSVLCVVQESLSKPNKPPKLVRFVGKHAEIALGHQKVPGLKMDNKFPPSPKVLAKVQSLASAWFVAEDALGCSGVNVIDRHRGPVLDEKSNLLSVIFGDDEDGLVVFQNLADALRYKLVEVSGEVLQTPNPIGSDEIGVTAWATYDGGLDYRLPELDSFSLGKLELEVTRLNSICDITEDFHSLFIVSRVLYGGIALELVDSEGEEDEKSVLFRVHADEECGSSDGLTDIADAFKRLHPL
jgi:hypothetical protein